MGRIAALGDARRIQVLAIAGVEPHPAKTAEEAVAAWQSLSPDVAVLILTSQAAAVLDERLAERPDLLVTVLP
jgi:vacuolar-type H+-ATPase subunit F/Vma7